MSSDIFTPADLDGIKSIRAIFKGTIPVDLDTDLNLRRWIRGWKGQLDEIEPRLRAYIESRHLAGLDKEDHLDTFTNHPMYLKYFEYFSISRQKNVINSVDNCVMLFEQTGGVDFNKLTKVMPCGDFADLYFVVCEALLRQILKQEKASGRPSGLTVIYDMEGFNLLDYANPNAAIMKITKHCFTLLQDYYCDIMHQIYIVNAPTLLSLMWELAKRFMNPATQKKIVILGSNYKQELRERVSMDALPVHYGGDRRDTSGKNDPDSCCPIPKAISSQDFFVPKRSIDSRDFTTEYLKPGAMVEIERNVTTSGATLYWHYWVNSDVTFSVYRIINDNKQEPLKFRFTYNTPKLPEEGSLVCDQPGLYVLKFENNSTTWFSLKLEYFADIEKFENADI